LILAIDIGNSFIHAALYDSGRIVFLKKFPTALRYPSPLFKQLLSKIKKKNLSAGIASVVPGVNRFWENSIRKYLNIKPAFINSKMILPISLKVSNPGKLGADRICNAAAAYQYFKQKQNVIAVDFGTAITYDVVLKQGDFIGGVISPGIETSAKALNTYTSKLPMLRSNDFTFSRNIVGKNTIEAIKSGVVYSALASFEGIIKGIEKELKRKFKVLLTGGFAGLIHGETTIKTVVQPNLVLDGINYIMKVNDGY
jgi:type III pantothenate kinase